MASRTVSSSEVKLWLYIDSQKIQLGQISRDFAILREAYVIQVGQLAVVETIVNGQLSNTRRVRITDFCQETRRVSFEQY